MPPSLPLNAVRAFEAAARTGSFSKAGRELGVSSAAVSQQVRLLEEHWNEVLFIRQGNRISLTEAGKTAYPQIAQAMTSLAALSDVMQRQESRQKRITLSAPQSIAETWLATALATLDPEALERLNVRVEDDPVDLATEKVDLRVFYGHDLYTEYHIETLFSDALIAVASPGFAACRGRGLDAIWEGEFIHTDWGRGFASSPDWVTALREQRLIQRHRGPRVQSSSMALNLARHGIGVALLPALMARDDLVSGRVVEMGLAPVQLAFPYCVAVPKRHASNATVNGVIQALKDVAAVAPTRSKGARPG